MVILLLDIWLQKNEKKNKIKRQTDKKQTPQLLMLGLVAFCHFYLR